MEQTGELAEVVRALTAANGALLDATSAGDMDEVARLLADISSLERRRNRIVRRSRAQAAAVPKSSYEAAIPIRDQVIRALRLTGRPANARLISDVTLARWAERVDTAKLSSLRRDEERSWLNSHRSTGRAAREVYIVPALSFDRLAPVRATVALSTWPMSTRLLAPLSPRVNMLHSTIALAREAAIMSGTTYETAMTGLVARLGSTIPGVAPFSSDIATIILCAEAELAAIEDTDEMERAEAAERAEEQLSAQALLFGHQIRVIQSRTAKGSR